MRTEWLHKELHNACYREDQEVDPFSIYYLRRGVTSPLITIVFVSGIYKKKINIISQNEDQRSSIMFLSVQEGVSK